MLSRNELLVLNTMKFFSIGEYGSTHELSENYESQKRIKRSKPEGKLNNEHMALQIVQEKGK